MRHSPSVRNSIRHKPFISAAIILFLCLTGKAVASSPPAGFPAPAMDYAYCDELRFYLDVTIEDHAFVDPGAYFQKTWRIVNSGTCAWTTSYKLAFVNGDLLNAPRETNLPSAVAPGESVDLTVNMKAPSLPGDYIGDWMLRNAAGELFGWGPDNCSFWIYIVVTETKSTEHEPYCIGGRPVTPSPTFTPQTPTETASPTASHTAVAGGAVLPTPTRTPTPGGAGGGTTAAIPEETTVESEAFRPSGTLMPGITTFIPTPLDLSSDPAVIGANLFLAALIMLPFAWASESATNMAAEHEDFLRNKFPLTKWAFDLQQRITGIFGYRLNRFSFRRDFGKLLGVTAFYGLVFSLLDKTWRPFSLNGLFLFLSMAVAYGIVGIADDIVQWRAIHKWGLPAELNVHPANIVLAAASTAVSRVFSLAPGLMFGTPEALRFNEETMSLHQRGHLVKVGAAAFVALGLCAWLPTIVIDLSRKAALPGWAFTALGALEAFLLVVFAVTLENLFVQTLGFSEGIGRALRKRSRVLWLVSLIAVTFLFFHTLINPRGELSEALENGNVIVFASIASLFIVAVIILRAWHTLRRRRGNLSGRKEIRRPP
jgi:hypothetical protein